MQILKSAPTLKLWKFNKKGYRMPKTSYIKRIKVENLFGTYNYTILSNDINPNLIILYGDNGCGKTTILEIVYYLLSTKVNKGHKSCICNKKFSFFEIEFTNDVKIALSREKNELIGTYKAEFFKSGKKILEHNFLAELNDNGSFSAPVKAQDGTSYLKFLNLLKLNGISADFLSDDRKLNSVVNNDNYINSGRFSPQYYIDDNEGDSLNEKLKKAIKAAVDWFGKQNLAASDKGSQSMNKVYTNILKSLAVKTTNEASVNIETIKSNLEKLNDESKKYAKYGLMPEVEVADLSAALDAATDNLRLAKQIIDPYIDSMKAKFKALSKLENVIDKFITNLNTRFFTDKTASFNISEGIEIKNKNNEKLNIKQLSSGEKQLLLLLCDAIASRDKSNLLIIDEPELSLNIKWKRNLLKTLLDCTEGSNSSFIIATHSIELLTEYRECVNKLDSKIGGIK